MLTHFAAAFIAVFLAELPDKTMVATLVLTTRFKRPGYVWLGVSAAFLVHVVLAVVLGSLLATLPDRQRLPIVHVKLEGLSVLEAARLTGMSVSAVKIGVHRGLKAIAAKIRGTA